jgi:cysteine desulfurase family protein (TIGR01976 family)
MPVRYARAVSISPSITPLDVEAVRARFPSLARTMHGQPVAFLDGPGGSQTPDSVIGAIARYLETSNANLGGAFVTSRETDTHYQQARLAAADFTASRADEIAFGANMTTLNFQLAHAIARTLKPGDEIIVTQLDHDGNVSPWLRVADDHALTVHTAPIRPDDVTIDTDALEQLISPKTRVVAFTLASNAVGSLTDARRISDAAHRVGALSWMDGVHYAPHRRIDRAALGGDVLLCSPYKFFGPHLGLASIRHDLAERLPADRVRPADEKPAGHRFETGTQSHEALAGFVAAVDYLAGLGIGDTRREQLDTAFARITAHEERLSARILSRLTAIDGVRVYGITDPGRVAERTPTFAFTVCGVSPRAVSATLGSHGLFTWDGNYYALNVMNALGLEGAGGAVRAGFLHYTTEQEADRLADAVAMLARGG